MEHDVGTKPVRNGMIGLVTSAAAWLGRVTTASVLRGRRRLIALALVGLLLRLACSPLYGTQDVEWWKAWGTYAVTQSLIGIYGAPDARIVELAKEGKSREEILHETQTVIRFEPYQYFRTEYRLVQPPIYIYSLFVSTLLYRSVDHDLRNTRVFNVFINIQPILASALLALLIGWAVGRIGSSEFGHAAGLIYWLNPLVLLNAPIQGYQDPLCALFATAAVVSLYRHRLAGAWILLVLAVLTKPQGVLILPVVLFVGLLEHHMIRNLAAWAAAAVTGMIVALPYLLAGRFLSVVLGVLSIAESSGDLSRQSLNIWWPVQVAFNGVNAYAAGTASFWTALIGGSPCWNCDAAAQLFTARTGWPVQAIGFILLTGFTAVNLYAVRLHRSSDRRVILSAAALQVYGYFMLRVGVQANHYFILVPMFALCLAPSGRRLASYAVICGMFLMQDLIFYGFGRDLNQGIVLLTRMSLGWTTIVLAVVNFAIFVWLTKRHIRYGDALPGHRPV